MIESSIALMGRYTLVYNAVMFVMLGMLLGFVLGDADGASALVVALLVWVVVLVATAVIGSVLMGRANRGLLEHVGTASPAVAQDSAAELAPAQVVRHRLARRSTGYVAGFAAQHPLAFSVLVRVMAAEGPRLAVALAPPRAGGYRAGSFLGVRLGVEHPDVAVLDPAATPATMEKQYAAALARPGAVRPPLGWGSTTLWAAAGVVAGLVIGLVVGVLLG